MVKNDLQLNIPTVAISFYLLFFLPKTKIDQFNLIPISNS